ncbi:MAG: hypothetical protein DMG59_22580 [Acidobacteria bacterium]|nr:MAG: hypothetical protein DMG59_22580 [Acidobacteriota bacterium]
MLDQMTRRRKFVFSLIGFATAFGLLEFTYRFLDTVARGRHVSPLIPLIEELTGSYTAFAFVPLVIWTARRYRLDVAKWARSLPMHVAVLVLGAFVHTSLMWGSRVLLFPVFGLGPYDYGAMPTRYFMEFPAQTIGYSIGVALVYLYDRQVRSVELENALSKAQLRNLRLQLQPHFLFNTLNTVSDLMYEDVGAADRMIARLSDLLRLSLEQGDAQEVTLEREIEFLDLYVETMKARLEERLNVRVEADEETRCALVPPLLLQPLIENSIRHGAHPMSSVVDVRVNARRDDGVLRLEVRDHGPGLAGAPDAALRNGIGLSNTVGRLERLYGGEQRVGLQNAPDGGLVVTLKVPYHVHSGPAG